VPLSACDLQLFYFSLTFGVVKVGRADTSEILSQLLVLHKLLGRVRPISFTPMLRMPTSSMSGGEGGTRTTKSNPTPETCAGCAKHALSELFRADHPETIKSPRTTPCVLVLPARFEAARTIVEAHVGAHFQNNGVQKNLLHQAEGPSLASGKPS